MSEYIPSQDKLNRDKKEGILKILQNQKNSPSYKNLLALIELELEIVKNKMLDSTPETLFELKGQALGLRNLANTLRNPRRPN